MPPSIAPCPHETCPIGYKLNTHISETALKCHTVNDKHKTLEELVRELVVLQKEQKDDLERHMEVEEIHHSAVNLAVELLKQKLEIWSSIAAWVSGIGITVLTAIGGLVWYIVELLLDLKLSS